MLTLEQFNAKQKLLGKSVRMNTEYFVGDSTCYLELKGFVNTLN